MEHLPGHPDPCTRARLLDLFEVKEEIKDLDADPQTECSEAKGGLLEEASIRTGFEIYQADSKRKRE